MNACEWAHFWQVIDHEICDCDIVLTAKGYKLDGIDGLKSRLKILDAGGNAPKSCDYIQPYRFKLLFIEFSDLLQQYQKVNDVVQELQTALPYKKSKHLSEYKQLFRLCKPEKQIQDEIEQKICDTDFILRQVEDGKLLKADLALRVPNHVFIVWHNRAMDVDSARMLDNLVMPIKASLSKANLRYINANEVHFLTLQDYAERYGQNI